MFRNIIWDVDGTLFNTYPAIARAFQAALNGLGKDASLGWIEALAKTSISHCVTTLSSQYQLNEKDIGQAFEEHYDRTPLQEQPLFPGVIAVCEYICTLGGKNVIVTHRGRESTNELLTVNKMTHYFTDCLTRDDGYPKKPHPAAFEAMLKMHNLQREETMAIGDRGIDVLAGQATGIFTCLFGLKDDGVAADLTVSSFDEVYRYLTSGTTNPDGQSPIVLDMRHEMKTRRPIRIYLLIMVVITALGLPARMVQDQLPTWYTLYFGDYLWAMLLFFIFALTLQNISTFKAAITTLLFAYIIEVSQLFHPQWLDDIRSIKLFALVLGYGFLWSDIVAYTLGISTGALVEHFLLRNRSRNAQPKIAEDIAP